MAVGSGSNIGLIRKANEDSYYVNQELGVYLVADGMGGHENGQVASSLAVEVFVRLAAQLKPEEFTIDQMKNMVDEANEAVFRYQEDVAGKIMGTTFTAAVINKQSMLIAHIGDSRAYLQRGQEIIQLTDDHSYLAELARLGKLDQEDIQNSKQKNVLLKALGPEAHVDAQFLSETIEIGDILLLCTDGLYNAMTVEEIKDFLEHGHSLQAAADAMIALALSRGGSDNMTLVVYRHENK